MILIINNEHNYGASAIVSKRHWRVKAGLACTPVQRLVVPAYHVRIIDTRDLVGIFVADDEDDRAFIMDECTDAPGCEYAELPNGG